MNDIVHQINAVSREVGGRTLGAGEARTTTIARTYDTSVEELWDAVTSPERIPRWFLPVSGDLRLGGRYQLEGNAGGTIERCNPPNGFTATWEYGGEVSWIEVRLRPEPGAGARLELEHIAPLSDERWTEFGPGATGVGWDLAFLGLGWHLESGWSVGAGEGAAWMASPQGREYTSLSSARWCDASIAAGTDAGAARAAAARTTAAYTGDADGA
jgi:uncharacterized protein YndB with AHSA1/START domain